MQTLFISYLKLHHELFTSETESGRSCNLSVPLASHVKAQTSLRCELQPDVWSIITAVKLESSECMMLYLFYCPKHVLHGVPRHF